MYIYIPMKYLNINGSLYNVLPCFNVLPMIPPLLIITGPARPGHQEGCVDSHWRQADDEANR